MTPRYDLGYVWRISLVAAMGGLLFGYDWVVVGGAKPFFERSFGLTTAAEIGWANSCAIVGCLIGSLATGALFVPESPRWLLAAGARDRARRVLARIGGEEYASSQSVEIEKTLAGGRERATDLRALLAPGVRAVVLVGVALAVLQQWSGINSIFNYAEEIYREAGYGIGDIMFNIVITGTINLVFTVVAIVMVDRVGRRALMLAGCAAIGVSHLLLGAAYAAGLRGLPILVFTLCSLGGYAVSLAPVTWVLIAEIFPNRVRGAAVSVAVSALWTACFILTFAFPLLQRSAGIAATFWIYAATCFAGFLFVRARVPETRGRTLEQIERELGLQPSCRIGAPARRVHDEPRAGRDDGLGRGREPARPVAGRRGRRRGA